MPYKKVIEKCPMCSIVHDWDKVCPDMTKQKRYMLKMLGFLDASPAFLSPYSFPDNQGTDISVP